MINALFSIVQLNVKIELHVLNELNINKCNADKAATKINRKKMREKAIKY